VRLLIILLDFGERAMVYIFPVTFVHQDAKSAPAVTKIFADDR
jgi:hypothetical protein